MQNIKQVTDERGSRYGSFEDGSRLMRRLKEVMWNTDGYTRLGCDQKEALEMIQHKIARIINGDPSYQDSWVDIAGYASLIVERLKRDEESTLPRNQGIGGLSKCGTTAATRLYNEARALGGSQFVGSPHGDEKQD